MDVLAKKSLTERDIRHALVGGGAPFDFRKQFVCVANSNTFVDWEADLLACTKAGFLTEVEIKVSATDWKNDAKKDKWFPRDSATLARLNMPWWTAEAPQRRVYGWEKIKNFYYAAPDVLAQRWAELDIPPFAGVIAVRWALDDSYLRCDIIRPAQAIPGFRKLTDKEMLNLARLGSMRAWS